MTKRKTHGLSRTKEYNTWCRMIARCENVKNGDYDKYGGRGITVTQIWRKSFEAFLKDMRNAPSKQHSIDRIDNNKGYFPGNCRWATVREQCRNRRSNNIIEINGEKKCLVDWCEHFGISLHTFKTRKRNGVSIDHIFLPAGSVHYPLNYRAKYERR